MNLTAAQEAIDGKSDVKKAAGPSEKKEADDVEKPGLLEKLTKELLKEVDEGASQKKAAPQNKFDEKFDQVAKGMRSASVKLDEKQTGSDTTKIQEQVIRDLDELIKQLQNPPPPNGGGGGGGAGGSSGGASSSRGGGRGGASGRQNRGAMGNRSQSPSGQAKQQKGEGDGSQGGTERKNAEGSEERSESERAAAEAAARKQKLEMDVWGHLPPHLREQLLNTYGERMLPKYEQLVKQFYEALSDQSVGKSRRDPK